MLFLRPRRLEEILLLGLGVEELDSEREEGTAHKTASASASTSISIAIAAVSCPPPSIVPHRGQSVSVPRPAAAVRLTPLPPLPSVLRPTMPMASAKDPAVHRPPNTAPASAHYNAVEEVADRTPSDRSGGWPHGRAGLGAGLG
uniref:Uncharacterized protein n=1 Tax=Oryza brachyantha TaxID=4533 RepID=J3NCS2_ORYBR